MLSEMPTELQTFVTIQFKVQSEVAASSPHIQNKISGFCLLLICEINTILDMTREQLMEAILSFGQENEKHKPGFASK